LRKFRGGGEEENEFVMYFTYISALWYPINLGGKYYINIKFTEGILMHIL
jgi:hypothetical protein